MPRKITTEDALRMMRNMKQVTDKVVDNNSGVAVSYVAGSNIDITGNVISVITADDAEQDNTKPITAAAVYTEIGNINSLLESI